MAELIEPLSSEFPDDMENIEPNLEDMHIMEDISGNDFLDISQSFSNGAIMDDSIEDDSIIYGNETTNPFGDETTLADETRDSSVNISQYSQGSQGSLHPSHLQGGNKKSVNKSAKKTVKRSTRKEKNKSVKKIRKAKKIRKVKKTRKAKKTRKTKKTRKAKKTRNNKKQREQ